MMVPCPNVYCEDGQVEDLSACFDPECCTRYTPCPFCLGTGEIPENEAAAYRGEDQ